jgi:hypothetical protein
MGRPEGKRLSGRLRRRWLDNNKIDVRDIGWGGVNLIRLAQDSDHWRALLNTVMKFGFQKMLGSS